MSYYYITENYMLLVEIRDLGETTESDPLCITDLFQNKYLAYFLLIIASNKLLYIIRFIWCNFQCGCKNIFKKNFNFFCPHKVEKTTPKSCILMAVGSFFFLCSPAYPKQPRTSFLFHKFFYTIISARITGWNISNQICQRLRASIIIENTEYNMKEMKTN